MLSSLVLHGTSSPDRPAVVTPEESVSWGELAEQARWLEGRYPQLGRRRVGFAFGPTPVTYAALSALEALRCDIVLLDGRLPSEDIERLARHLHLGAVVRAAGPDLQVQDLSDEGPWSGEGTVTVLTSGSTDEAKLAGHTWGSLGRPVREHTGEVAPRWLLTYRPQLYAGLQVMLQSFADGGTLVVAEDLDPQSIAALMLSVGVDHVSATPSYWRRLMMLADPSVLKRVPLTQITVGGEVVDQPLLDRLQRTFPNARLVHIYATTELGRCFSVTDGRAGFPARYLEGARPDGVELKTHDGELLVRSPNAMRPRADEWCATGDLVEVRDGRALFVGRRSEMINVGGAKVHPIEVERVIRAIPGVSEVRVFAKASSIAGEVVACDIVPEVGEDAERLTRTVSQVCLSRLTSAQRPRLVRLVDHVDLSDAGKTIRSAAR